MERVESCILALLFGALLVLASLPTEAQGKKDKTLDPDTCQEAGTCWIPAGGKPQPIYKNVKKGTFNEGYTTGQKFLLPGGKMFDNHILWLVIIEEWYGPWCLYYHGERSYFKCLQGIKFESGGNPYAATKSDVWLERGMTSVNDGFAAEYDFDPCGDPEACVWAASQENHERREWIENGKLWDWLDGHDRLEKERWLAASGSLNASVVARMAKNANAHKITQEQVAEGKVTPWKRFIGQLRKWDKTGMIYAKKVGISITPWRMGFRLGRKEAQEKRYPMISWRPRAVHENEPDSGILVKIPVNKKAAKKKEIPKGITEVSLHGVTLAQIAEEYHTNVSSIVALNYEYTDEGMCYANGHFYDQDIMRPMPKAKAPFPGGKLFGKKCLKHQKEWRSIMGKTLKTTVRRGDPKFEKMQAEGFFPSDEMYDWWEENIGYCRVVDSPLVQHLLHKINNNV